MVKIKKRERTRELRSKGESIKRIAQKISVSPGSVSIWCKDIELTEQQNKKLQERVRVGSYLGRKKGSETNKKKKEESERFFKKEGGEMLGEMSKRDLFVAGVALYWGEGSKGEKLQITNSDPRIIQFFILWVREIFEIPKSDLIFYITINEMHKKRGEEIEKYWQDFLEVKPEQFTKTVFLKSKSKKCYSNFESYYGTLRVTVRRSSKIRRIVQGAMEKII